MGKKVKDCFLTEIVCVHSGWSWHQWKSLQAQKCTGEWRRSWVFYWAIEAIHSIIHAIFSIGSCIATIGILPIALLLKWCKIRMFLLLERINQGHKIKTLFFLGGLILTWDGTISVGPPSRACPRRESLNSRLLSRSNDDFRLRSLSRSLLSRSFSRIWPWLDGELPSVFRSGLRPCCAR